jgi:hypothetical protein
MNIPIDMEEMKDIYEKKIPREGTCGPTLVAFLTDKTVKEIIKYWSVDYKGYCSFHELEHELNKYGIKTQRMRSEYKYDYVLPEGIKKAIIRIQWKGIYSHWTIAQKNTHFIYLNIINNELWCFDNTAGWFKPDSFTGKKYMKEGKVTSYLAIL